MHKYALVIAAMGVCGVTLRLAAGAGTLDTTFNPSGTPPGTVTTSIGTESQGFGLTIQQDGKIVVVGSSIVSGVKEFAVARYTSTGSLDTSFGIGGRATLAIGTDSEAHAVVLQSDGKLVVVGYGTFGSNTLFAVVRYTTNGEPDTTFGASGIVTTLIGSNAQANGVALQQDGKIVAVGSADSSGTGQFVVVRYTTNGSLDTSFNGTGVVNTPVDSAGSSASSVALQQDGALVVAGQAQGVPVFTVVRYTTTGSFDTSFNGTGIVETPIGLFSQASGVVLQNNGTIVAAGQATFAGGTQIAVVRYTPNGVLDTTFNGTGIALASSAGTTFDAGNAVALQQNGKIVVAGVINPGGINSLAVARFTSSGALDSSFNSAGVQPGIVTTTLGTNDAANAVALQSDGKIVVAGFTHLTGTNLFAVARYNGDPINPCVVRFVNKYGFVV